jgi:hypothetical protein
MEHQLDATITVLLISKISSTCFGQTFAHLQGHKNETFTTYGTMSCYVVGRVSGRVAWHCVYVCVSGQYPTRMKVTNIINSLVHN